MLRFAQLVHRSADSLKLITLHLEGGSSAAAIQGGKSIDTSMGFTPLEGLMMSSRCGDIDPALVIHLMREEKWELDELERFLNRECGLFGVSGLSADTRELRDRLPDRRAQLALGMFCYRVCKYIGAYMAALGGAELSSSAAGSAKIPPSCVSESVPRWGGAGLPSTNVETLM